MTHRNKKSTRPIYNTIGVIFYSIAQWLVVSLISKKFSIGSFADYSLSLAVISPLSVFFNFGLRNFYNSTSISLEKNSIYTQRLFSIMLFIPVALIVKLVFFKDILLVTFLTVLALKSADMVSEVCYSIKQKASNIRYIGISLTVKSILILIVPTLILTLSPLSLNEYLLCLFAISALAAITDTINCQVILDCNLESLTKISLLAIPLALTSLVNSANANISRYLLNGLIDKSAVAIFTTHIFFYVSSISLISSFVQALLNKISKTLESKEEGKKLLRKKAIIIIGLSVLFIIGNQLLGQIIYKLIFGEKYIEYSKYMIYLNYIIPLGIAATILNFTKIAQNQYKTMFVIICITFMANLACSSYFIKRYQIVGAFYGMIVSQIIFVALSLTAILSKQRKIHEGIKC